MSDNLHPPFYQQDAILIQGSHTPSPINQSREHSPVFTGVRNLQLNGSSEKRAISGSSSPVNLVLEKERGVSDNGEIEKDNYNNFVFPKDAPGLATIRG